MDEPYPDYQKYSHRFVPDTKMAESDANLAGRIYICEKCALHAWDNVDAMNYLFDNYNAVMHIPVISVTGRINYYNKFRIVTEIRRCRFSDEDFFVRDIIQ